MQIRAFEPDLCQRCECAAALFLAARLSEAIHFEELFRCNCSEDQFWNNLLYAEQPDDSRQVRRLRRYHFARVVSGTWDSYRDTKHALEPSDVPPIVGTMIDCCAGCGHEVYVSQIEPFRTTHCDHDHTCPAQSSAEYLIRSY